MANIVENPNTMANIVENPNTKELFLASDCRSNGLVTTFAFDGTPIAQKIDGWKVIGQAPCVQSWYDEPGRYGTFYGSMSIAMLVDGEWKTFKMGESIAHLRNWLQDAETHNTVSIANQRAYSCRNVARNKASVQ